ncbi:MAG: hypothetical protein AAFZ80_00390 [Cyanobacteria bacterium P01_A01_bin.105]
MKLPGAIRPLFFLVLAAHAGLLAIPISGASDEIVPPPDPEGDSITVTRIPPAGEVAAKGAAPSPTAAPPPASAGSTQPRPAAAQPTRAPASQTAIAATPASNRRQGQQPQQVPTASGGNRTGSDSSASPRSSGGSQGSGSQASSSQDNRPSPDANLPNLPARQPATPPSQRPSAGGPGETSLIASLAEGASGGNVDGLSDLISFFNRAFTYSDIKTSPDDERTAIDTWLVTLRAETNQADLSEQALDTPLTIAYPLEDSVGFEPEEQAYNRDFLGCLSETPKPATVGVYFDRNGELAGPPQLLRSSGYGFLNDEAVERAKTFPGLPDATAQQAFTIPVEIDYDPDNCLQRVVIRAGLTN